jgi:hypothetical protein
LHPETEGVTLLERLFEFAVSGCQNLLLALLILPGRGAFPWAFQGAGSFFL